MKKLVVIALALLIASPGICEEKLGGPTLGGVPTVPTATGTILGTDSAGNAEWEKVTGGLGNCAFSRSSAGIYVLTCPGYAPVANPTFTGTVTLAPTTNATNISLSGALTFGANPVGGTCSVGSVVQSLSATLVPTCIAVSGSGSTVPNGSPPQILGWASANTPEAETLGGDVTLTRTGANAYSAIVGKINGNTIGALATLNVGTGLSSAAGNLNLTSPVTVANGGRGSTTAPTAGQIDIAQSATVYSPQTVSGDAVITIAGVMTVTKLNGVTPGGTCTGGQFVNVISASGVPTCATVAAGSFAPLTNPAGGQNNYAPVASPNFTGTISLGGTAFGGACTGGQFVQSISAGVVPTCATPASGSGLPSGGPPQLIGYAGANTGEAETIVGDASLSRTGTNTYTITVNKSNGTALTSLFAPLANPGGGTQNYAPIASPNFTGSISLGGTNITGLFAPLTNPTSGQNNYAPLASPTFTGTVTATNIYRSQASASSLGYNILMGTSSTTPQASITTIAPGAAAANNINALQMNVGGHWAVGNTNPVADAIAAQMIALGGLPSAAGASVNQIGFYTDSGLTVGNTYTPTLIASLAPTGFKTNVNVGIKTTPYTATGTADGLLLMEEDGNQTTFVQLKNAGTGANASEVFYLNNDIPHYGAIGMYNTGSTVGPIGPPDSLVLGTNGLGGISINSAVNAPINFWINSTNAEVMNGTAALDNTGTKDLITFYGNANGIAQNSVYNNSTGANAQALWQASTGTPASPAVELKAGVTGANYTGGTNANSVYLSSTGNNFNIISFNAGPIAFFVNGYNKGFFGGSGLQVNGPIYQNDGTIYTTPTPLVDQGTWTPDLQFGGSNSGVTYGVRVGNWWRTGKHVYVQFVMTLPAGAGSATGGAAICGLPGPMANQNQGFWPFLNFGGMVNMAGSIAGGMFQAGDNQNCVYLASNLTTNPGNATSISGLTNANFSTNANFQGSFLYVMP